MKLQWMATNNKVSSTVSDLQLLCPFAQLVLKINRQSKQ